MTDAAEGGALLDLPLLRRGKVRDVYSVGRDLLIVASDRVSAFDVVLPTPIPGKGRLLTHLSRFWFERTAEIVPNHYLATGLDRLAPLLGEAAATLAGRAMLVKAARRVDVECVVRGYLAGSAWREYTETGTIGGEVAASGLVRGERLDPPRFTPAWKRDDGHDEPISRLELGDRVGGDLAGRLETTSAALFRFASAHASARGILLADTKFEFGFVGERLTLIDEALTPDSSRFWDAASYGSGEEPTVLDKQPLRDWLERIGWDKRPPGPPLPEPVVAATAARYAEACRRLSGVPVPPTNRVGSD